MYSTPSIPDPEWLADCEVPLQADGERGGDGANLGHVDHTVQDGQQQHVQVVRVGSPI